MSRGRLFYCVVLGLGVACGRSNGDAKTAVEAGSDVACAPTGCPARKPKEIAPVEMQEKISMGSDERKACPDDMVLVDGMYCPDQYLEQHCLYNTNIDGSRSDKAPSLLWACGEFAPSTCKGDHFVHMRFCIDVFEWPNKKGAIPQDWMTYRTAKKAIEATGKRLCTAREYGKAAEGPNMHPIPYGDGYHRQSRPTFLPGGIVSGVCNFDRDMGHLDPSKARRPNDEMSQKLRAMLVPSGSMPDCVSDYGVRDLAGNLDEIVYNEGGVETCPKGERCYNYVSGLMGGHVWHVRNAARFITTAHNLDFGWYESGSRACKDVIF